MQALATAIAVYGAAALSRALAFDDGAVMLIWLPTSVALVAVLAGGPRLAAPGALGIAAWAAERGAGAATWAAAACSIAATFDHRSGVLAPLLGHGTAGLRNAEVVAIEAMSAAIAVRAPMTLLPDRAGGFCPVEVARSGRVGLTRLEWTAWFALAMIGAMIGTRRNTSTMLPVGTFATTWLRARVEPFSDAPAYLGNLVHFVLLAGIGGAIAHLLNATSSERIAHEARLRELAMTDLGSGLPNPRAFRARLQSREASPAGVQLLEVRVPDVERWAELAGRAAAIAIERSVGLALAQAFPDSFVAHLATGRYGLIVPGLVDAAAILARVRGAIDLQRIEAGGERGSLRSFVGVVDVPGGRLGDAESMLAAMATARQRAQSDPERYRRLPLSASLVEEHRDGLRAMRTVRDAVQEGRLRLLAQPIVRADGARERLHYEVLSRLVDEDGREIPPATFLSLLARMGTLQAFDRQVVARALERLGRDAALRDRTATCAINLTGPTVADPGFPAFLFERLSATGVAPATIKLATVAECVETPAAIERMRELGVDYLQGWGIALPMPMETLVAFHRHGAAGGGAQADAARVAG